MLRTSALALPLLLALTLAGCVAAPPPRGYEPPPAGPPFATEEEALAAAVEVYRQVIEIADEIGRDGGFEPERLSAVATDEFYARSLESFGFMREQGLVMVGATLARDMRLDSVEASPLAIHLIVCEDITGVDVIRPDGTSAVAADRADANLFRATFVLEGTLKLSTLVRQDELPC